MDAFLAMKSIEHCVRDIRSWMLNDNLKLNDNKTEFLITGTPQQGEIKYLLSFLVLVTRTSNLCPSLAVKSVSGSIQGCLCQHVSQIYAAF